MCNKLPIYSLIMVMKCTKVIQLCDWSFGCCRYNLGAFYFATNSFARAKFQFSEATRILRTFLGPTHPDTIDSQKSLDEMAAFVQ